MFAHMSDQQLLALCIGFPVMFVAFAFTVFELARATMDERAAARIAAQRGFIIRNR